MTSFYYYDQNPSGVCFLVQIKAFVVQTSLRLPKIEYERKNEKDSGRGSKMMSSCKWLFQRDFCNGAKLHRADLERGESHIGFVPHFGEVWTDGSGSE